VNKYKYHLYITGVVYLAVAALGWGLGQIEGISDSIGAGYGYLCIALAICPVVVIVRQLGMQKSLLCSTAALLAPIWFLYLEGLIENDETAYILAPYIRIKGYACSMIYMGLLVLCYTWILRFVKPRSKKFNRKILEIELNPFLLSIATVLALLIPLTIIGSQYANLDELWRGLTAGRSDGSNGTLLRRGSEGGVEAFYEPLMWLWQLTPTLAGLTWVTEINRGKPLSISSLIAVICGIAVTFFTFLGGSRGLLIFVLAVPIMLWFFYGIRLRLTFWLISIAGFFLAIGIMEFQVKTRGNMLDVLASGGSQVVEEKSTLNPLKSHRDNNLYFLCLVADKMPDIFPFEGYNDYIALLANPIPRAIWPGKPLLSGAKGINEVKLVYDSGPLKVGTSSLSCSIVGQSYQWFGVLGFVAVIPIYALLAAWFDSWYLSTRKPTLSQIALQGGAGFMMFWGFRDFSAFVTFIYPFALLYIVFLAFAKMRKYLSPST
jgi:hypothetical protein